MFESHVHTMGPMGVTRIALGAMGNPCGSHGHPVWEAMPYHGHVGDSMGANHGNNVGINRVALGGGPFGKRRVSMCVLWDYVVHY